MPCQISNVVVSADAADVDSASGFTSGIRVSGDIQGCAANQVNVTVQVGTQTFSQNNVAVDSSGHWSTQRFALRFRCGAQVYYSVVCADDQNCVTKGPATILCCPSADDIQISIVSNDPPAPVVVTAAELEQDDCIEGNRTYTYTVTSPTGPGYRYSWTITEGRQPGDAADVSNVLFENGGNSWSLRFPGDGEDRTVLVEVFPPGPCPRVMATRKLRDCGPRKCPPGFRWDPVLLRCVPDCPAGQTYDPITNKCVGQPGNGNGHGSNGGTLCCFLIYSWLGGFLFGMGAYHLNYGWCWIPLVIAAAFLVAWLIKCCKTCLKDLNWWEILYRPDKVLRAGLTCCELIRWHILGHSILLLIVYPILDGGLGLVASMDGVCDAIPALCGFLNVSSGGGSGSSFGSYAGLITAAGLALFTWLYVSNNCGGQRYKPDVYDRHTWPRCKCHH